MSKSNKKILGVIIGVFILSISIYGLYEFNKKSNKDEDIVLEDLSQKEYEKYISSIADRANEDYFKDVDDKTYTDLENFMSKYYDAMNNYGKEDVNKFIDNFMSDELSKDINIEGVLKSLEDYRSKNKNYTFKGEIMYIKEDTKEKDIYIGVREWSEITSKTGTNTDTQKIGGVYILKRHKDGFLIDLIIDSEEEFTVSETVKADEEANFDSKNK